MKDRLLSVVVQEIGAIETPEQDPLDAVILRDLRPDSLDAIVLAMAIEDEFAVSIAEAEIMALGEDATLRDVLALVERKGAV